MRFIVNLCELMKRYIFTCIFHCFQNRRGFCLNYEWFYGKFIPSMYVYMYPRMYVGSGTNYGDTLSSNTFKTIYRYLCWKTAKAKDQSPAFENKASQQTTPRSAVISPLFNSAASPASGFSSKSRASHKKSDEAATPRSVHATTPQPISSNDQNVNRGVSGLLETLQGIDDPSSNVGLVSVEALPCISRTSHLSFSSAGSRRSQGSQPILPRSQASSIADYYPVRVPRRLNSALELGRKESSGNRVARSQSVDQKRYK